MASKKTWIWIIVACLGMGVMALFGLAATGVYFVASHIETDRVSSAEALRAFDAARAAFKEQQPLFELDSKERPRPVRALRDIPSSPSRPDDLWILAWDPDEGRILKISLPFWMLRLGRRNIDVHHDESGFDLEDLDLDVEELERIGPALVFDLRAPEGERVLVWTR
jgi:hypothetical protein